MTTRKEKLNRLQVASPCRASWDEMRGDERRRHCLECNKFVYDTSKMTAAQIQALIEASRGNLCVRLTRNASGELLTLEPSLPDYQFSSRRVSPVSAVVMTAIIGLNGQAWPREARAAIPVSVHEYEDGNNKERHKNLPTGDLASLTGTITDDKGNAISRATINLYNILDGRLRKEFSDADGAFNFRFLGAGIYRLNVSAKGYRDIHQSSLFVHSGQTQRLELSTGEIGIETVTMGGAMGLRETPLREAFNESEMIAIAYVGQSVMTDKDEDTVRVRTELLISSVLKGDAKSRTVSFYHHESSGLDAVDEFKPGDRVLAFMKPDEDDEPQRKNTGYISARNIFGLVKLPDDNLEAYRQRIMALAAVSLEGNAKPEDVMEWLTGTAENPLTRHEVLTELSEGLTQLNDIANERGEAGEQSALAMREVINNFIQEGGSFKKDIDPSVYAAFLNDAQKERLKTALVTSKQLTEAELRLFRIVRAWSEDGLFPWLMDRLKNEISTQDYVEREMMQLIAEHLDDEEMKDLVDKVESQVAELTRSFYQPNKEDASDEANEKKSNAKENEVERWAAIEAKIAAKQKELRQKFLAKLDQRSLH